MAESVEKLLEEAYFYLADGLYSLLAYEDQIGIPSAVWEKVRVNLRSALFKVELAATNRIVFQTDHGEVTMRYRPWEEGAQSNGFVP